VKKKPHIKKQLHELFEQVLLTVFEKLGLNPDTITPAGKS